LHSFLYKDIYITDLGNQVFGINFPSFLKKEYLKWGFIKLKLKAFISIL
jgi:hypothetical protein